MKIISVVVLMSAVVVCCFWAYTQETKSDPTNQVKEIQMIHKILFEKMPGKWEGNCRTWFEPGKLADESNVSGEINKVFVGQFLRHVYHGMIKGKPQQGEERIAFNSITMTFQTCWINDFHMNYTIKFSEGKATECGFTVRGEYDSGENQPR